MKKIEEDEISSSFCYTIDGDVMNGIFLVNKESGMTSRDVVDRIGKIFHTKKVGHTGTLDPMAEGLLIVCVGEATKLVEILTHEEKEYLAEVTLGIATDTLDHEGTVLEKCDVFKTKEEIEAVLQSMIGSYEQEVPIYSAVKIQGHKLYEYARKGEKIELPKRKVVVYSLSLASVVRYENGKTIFSIKTRVSKGTYIRSLVRDIAKNLGTIGMMSKLKRTKVGDFSLDHAYTIEEYQNGYGKAKEMMEVLSSFPFYTVDKKMEEKICHGALLLKGDYKTPLVFCNEEGKILALYREYEKDHTLIKPWKMFH